MATAELTRPAPSPRDPDTPIVVFEDVSIAFDQNEVLTNVSFKVMPGESRIILGPAGVGKSVLLKLANGLLCPDSGRVLVFGKMSTPCPSRTSSPSATASAWSFRRARSLT